MSAEITYEPLAYCADCAEGDRDDPEEWAAQHNNEWHTPETETP